MRRKALKKLIKRMRKAIEESKKKKPISRKQLLEVLLPGLDWLFGQEYAKYDEGHKNKTESDKNNGGVDNASRR
tara:strand:- start:851 stop:1072 length:222 start_codon:yes stop_codon:yes gene_type:complete